MNWFLKYVWVFLVFILRCFIRNLMEMVQLGKVILSNFSSRKYNMYIILHKFVSFYFRLKRINRIVQGFS